MFRILEGNPKKELLRGLWGFHASGTWRMGGHPCMDGDIWEFPKIRGTLILGILLFRVLYEGPLFSETIYGDDTTFRGSLLSTRDPEWT